MNREDIYPTDKKKAEALNRKAEEEARALTDRLMSLGNLASTPAGQNSLTLEQKAFIEKMSQPTEAGLLKAFSSLLTQHPYEIGEYYFFRCVTFHQIMKVIHVGPLEIVGVDGVWVADSGLWDDAFATGKIKDFAPAPPGAMILGRLSIVDAIKWPHKFVLKAES